MQFKNKKKFHSLWLCILIVLLFCPSFALADSLTSMSIYMWHSDGELINTPSTSIDSISVYFTPQTALLSGDGVKVNFQSDFNIADITGNEAAVILSQDHTAFNIIMGAVEVNSQDLFITISAGGDNPTGSAVVNIVGHHVTTPSIYGFYAVTVSTWNLGDDNAWGGSGVNADTLKDSGISLVEIGSHGDVDITASVDPTLTLTLSATSCNLNSLDANKLNTCSYSTIVSTNSVNGYGLYIKGDGNLRSPTTSLKNELDGTVTAGSEEYGFSSSLNASQCLDLNDQNLNEMTAELVTTDDQLFASSPAPVVYQETTVCHAVAVIGTTPAGVYSQLVIITAVGNF